MKLFFLLIGSKNLLTRMFHKYLGEKFGMSAPPEKTAKEPKDKGKGKKSTKIETDMKEDITELLEQKTDYCFTIVQSLNIGSFAINRLISDIKPRYAFF